MVKIKHQNPEIGDVFSRWRVTGETVHLNGRLTTPVECLCGNIARVLKQNPVTGKTTSCGCLKNENTGNRFRKHGKRREPIYAIWSSIKQRCLDTGSTSYKSYGGRGIRISESWLVFENFYADMGNSPFHGASIERKDTNGDYCIENCIWATAAEQSNNRRSSVRFNVFGETLTLKELAERYCIKTQH